MDPPSEQPETQDPELGNPCFVHWRQLPPAADAFARKDWVFLADIVHNETFTSTATYTVRDIAGRKLLLAIYPTKPAGRHSLVAATRGPDGTMKFSQAFGPRAQKLWSMQPGSMVAIQDCDAHWFMDGRVGVRLNEDDGDLAGFKSFPCTVAQFAEMDKRRVAAAEDTDAKCAKCATPGASKCCKKCKTRYCSQECQLQHWTQGHKSECPILTAQRGYSELVAYPPEDRTH